MKSLFVGYICVICKNYGFIKITSRISCFCCRFSLFNLWIWSLILCVLEREERERLEQEQREEEEREYQERLRKLEEQERKQRARQQEIEERERRKEEERRAPEEKPSKVTHMNPASILLVHHTLLGLSQFLN